MHHPCDISSTGQRTGFAPVHTTLQQTAGQRSGVPALTPTNSFISVHQNFSRQPRHFDHPPVAFTPARPGQYSGPPTTQSAAVPLQAPTHFGHQSPWAPQPAGSFPVAHFQGSTSPSYTAGDADPRDYFAIERPAGSPHSTGRSDISGSPTLGERTPPPSQAALPVKLLSSLSPEQQRIVKDADPNHQQVIMTILVSSDFIERFDIPAEKLQVFYTSVPHERSEGDKQGSRGGAAGYSCRWHACPQAARMIKRRDHMLNHIRGHFGVKPFPCKFGNGVNLPRCAARFLRADDLKRHVRTVHSKDVDSHLNIIDSDLKKQPKNKRGVVDAAEVQRTRGYQPYSTSTPHHRRSVSDAAANYDFTQPPQAQPQAFFAHGPGQSIPSGYENRPFGQFTA